MEKKNIFLVFKELKNIVIQEETLNVIQYC